MEGIFVAILITTVGLLSALGGICIIKEGREDASALN